MDSLKSLPFEPSLGTSEAATRILAEAALLAAELVKVDTNRNQQEEVEKRRTDAIRQCQSCRGQARQALLASVHVLFDLVKQGWTVKVNAGKVTITRPLLRDEDDERVLIRRQLHAERDEQLRQEAVRTFVGNMEIRRRHNGKLVSIFSLMHDGRELAASLGASAAATSCEEQVDRLSRAIQPYLQFVRSDETCELTGLRLADIWRYFRHTWATPYKSVPGRSMMILIRDKATPFHAIIGIAALSSATVGLEVRDKEIGWTLPVMLRKIKGGRPEVYGRWMLRTVEAALEEIYREDLLRDGILSPSDFRQPTVKVINQLIKISRAARAEHYRLMQAKDYKKTSAKSILFDDEHWKKQAEMPLFRAKRTQELASLFKVRRVLSQALSAKPSRTEVLALLEQREGRDALARIIRRAKADRVGTVMADLTVCGAVPPYGDVLGGKLVAMLMASPEVIDEYQRRYRNSSSIIASSMAGRPVVRPAKLVLISTTSLFGVRPNQYDRLSIPCARLNEGAKGVVRYEFLGETKGIGTFQFGPPTVEALSLLLAQGASGQRVNSVFGEGVNPRLRKIRDGLDLLKLPTQELLSHGAPRLVYLARLIHNTSEFLLGLDNTPEYLVPLNSGRDATNSISRWWIERWLVQRVAREDVLQRVERHTLVHPITHGAKVDLPVSTDDRDRLF